MKKPLLKTKNPRIRIKNTEIWILTCEPYLQSNRQESVQEYAKNPKSKNRRTTKNLQSLVRQEICQESKSPKWFQKFLQVLESTKALFSYPHSFFPRIRLHPPPLHGGYEIPSMYGMEVSIFRLPDFAVLPTKKFEKK